MANTFVPHTITLKGKPVEINSPWVMGILNVTPDSFYGNSRCNEEAVIVERIHKIIDEGGKIIDIGDIRRARVPTKFLPKRNIVVCRQDLRLSSAKHPMPLCRLTPFAPM